MIKFITKTYKVLYSLLSSAKLAILLLVSILICCLLGVTVFRADEYGKIIFRAVWFNSLLVLLVTNVACCFFGRIWGRRITVISFGMILFHLSFVTMFLAIAYNSLFYFRGNIRLTEGESIKIGDVKSYDATDKGPLFKFSRFSGDVNLVKVHTSYKVNGDDKRVAYDLVVGNSGNTVKDSVYVTHKVTYNGIDFFNDKEGYSVLVTLADANAHELYGAYIPLQSIPDGKGSYLYSTGITENGVVRSDALLFPFPPEKVRMAVEVNYQPSKLKERVGDAHFKVFALNDNEMPLLDKPLAEGTSAINKNFKAGEYELAMKDVRYWVGMLVRYEPGKPIVLASLWVGLAGMIITTLGRMLRGR